MREIKFRGKRIDNNEWVYGYLQKQAVEGEEYYITWPCTELINNCRVVIPKTIGQFTGLYDKNNTPIYEDDIVKSPYTNDDNLYIIAYWKFGFMLQGQKDGNYYDFIGDLLGILEVRGNIYDNEVEE